MARKTQMGLTHVTRSSLPANRENMKKAGRKAHKNGITLEKAVEAYGRQLIEDDNFEMELYRNHDAMQKARGRGGRLTAFTTGVSPCDFTFFCSTKTFEWVEGGMIEAKSRQRKSINKSAISHHQKAQLIRMEKLGKCGLVLVSLTDSNNEPMFFIVPITHWYGGTKKSHNIEDMHSIGYLCKTVSVWDDNQKEHKAPDILSVLKKIDEDDGYKELPKKYRELNDNKKLKNKIYSTIDEDFEDIIDVE